MNIGFVLLVVSVLLVVIGFKGFTPSGLEFSKQTTLRGRKGKIVGAICIFLGIGLIPLFALVFFMYASRLSG